MLVDIIAGARPNFIKIAPVIREIKKSDKIEYRLVHTGQHYDHNMSGSFFKDLEIPKPDINLEAGSGTHAEQTAKIMTAYEKLLEKSKCDLCIVFGDVNSTLACSIVAKKMNIKVAHVEGGIRSFDLTMPEEINRMVTDSITDYFFTTSETANLNLKKAGIPENRIHFVGNTMIDSLQYHRNHFIKPDCWDKYRLKEKEYFILTLHRPANVDEEKKLTDYIREIAENVNGLPVIFPVHPRTANKLKGFETEYPNLHFTEPMRYLEFNYLVEHSKGVITDSGGITEETTVMGVPCITLRDNTERPETVTEGTNELIGTNPEKLKPALKNILEGNWKQGNIPTLWDGQTSKRIVKILEQL